VEIVERRLIWTKQMAKKNRRRSYPKSRPRVAGDGEGLKRGKKKFGCGFGLSAEKKQKG
jgi:hypothetical protein